MSTLTWAFTGISATLHSYMTHGHSAKHVFIFFAILLLVLFAAFFVYGMRLTLEQYTDTRSLGSEVKSAVTGKRESAARIDSASAFSVGPASARVTVVEFVDFQCPFCKEMTRTFRTIMKRYEKKDVRFVFRHFPLTSIHPAALTAAHASLCAREQGQFLAFHDAVYEAQESLDDAQIARIAQNLTVNLNQFNACQAENKYKDILIKDLDDVTELGLEGTPTIFVNQTRFIGVAPEAEIDKAIQKELDK